MRKSICSILTAAVCFQVSIVVYAILKYSNAAHEMIFTTEEISEEQYGLGSESLKSISTKYSSLKNIRT